MVTDSPQLTEAVHGQVATAPLGAIVSVVASLQDGTELVRIAGDHLHRAASTIKLPVLIGLARAVDSGRLSLDTRVPIAETDRVEGSGVLYWLDPALELRLRDHAWLMIADSDNTASNVLIEAVGIPAIAHAAADLGVIRSGLNRRFLGRSPEPGTPDNLVSADDLVRFVNAILNDEAASPGLCAWMRQLLRDQKYQNSIPRTLPDGISYGGKTGFINGINHDCGFLSGPRGVISVATLTTGLDDRYAAQELMGAIGERLGRSLLG